MACHRRFRLLAFCSMSAAVLAVVPAASAQAASSPGWRVVFSHHYGGAATGSGFIAVSAPGPRTAWAVGSEGSTGSPRTGRPASARWQHGMWRAVRMPSGLSGTLGAVSADSAKDAWTVSLQNGYALHWNGTRWSVAKRWPEHALPRELTGVTALTPSNVWVFGGPGAFPGLGTWHFNGRAWTHVTSAPGNGIEEASALSATNIWAIGSATSPQSSIAHFTGAWHTVKATALTGLQFAAIAAVGSHDVWAVGTVQTNAFRPRLVHLTSSGWSRMALPWQVDPVDLAPDGRGGLWITAQDSSGLLVIHRSAAGTWSRTRIGPGASLLRIALIPGTTALWGGGAVKSTSGPNAAVWEHGRIG
jgi:hypothetical protein